MKSPLILIALIILILLSVGCMKKDPEPCIPDWKCSDWTDCSLFGIQTRDCSDLNSCGTVEGRPQELHDCAAQTNAQPVSPVAGHGYSIRGQYYDYDPRVPFITTDDILRAKQTALEKVMVCSSCDTSALIEEMNYICIDLKNEGTQGFTIAQASATGSSSRDQILNFYWRTLDTIQREENCQRYASGLLALNRPLTNLESDLEISQSDEKIEVDGYNNVAGSFNKEIYQCPGGETIGIDGLCHRTCSSSNLYCPSDSTCLSGRCSRCPTGFSLTADNTCILDNAAGQTDSVTADRTYVLPVTSPSPNPTAAVTPQPQSYHYHTYGPGDIIGTEDTKGTKLSIISYDAATDQYLVFSGGIGCCLKMDRKEVEDKYRFKYGHSSSMANCPC